MASMFVEALRAETSPWLELELRVAQLLEAHYELLVRWNRVVNLTNVVELHDAVRKHYFESLFLGICCPHPPATLADVGSGGGFPGVPLAALWPDSHVTLVESDTRKAAFLRECRDILPNLTVECARAEQLTGRFAAIVSRAVRPVDVLRVARRCAPSVGLIVATRDVLSLKIRNPHLVDLPMGGGVAVWADVPRET